MDIVCAFACNSLPTKLAIFSLGMATDLSYVAGAPMLENLHRFALFNLATSMAWNLGRAFTTVLTLCVVGRPLLRILRRANRRGTFAERPTTVP